MVLAQAQAQPPCRFSSHLCTALPRPLQGTSVPPDSVETDSRITVWWGGRGAAHPGISLKGPLCPASSSRRAPLQGAAVTAVCAC